MTRRNGTFISGLFIIAASFSVAAWAADGVVEISQVCATGDGCFSGDSPGFPVEIDGSVGRSYRLTSDLQVPDEDTTAILVTARGVSIDLGGFSILGVTTCTFAPFASCAPVGVGIGVHAAVEAVSVRNGSLLGIGRFGLLLGNDALVSNVRVLNCGSSGVAVGFSSKVEDVIVSANGLNGINANIRSVVIDSVASVNGGIGVRADSSTVVSRTSATLNGEVGIQVGGGSNLSLSTANSNANHGIVVFAGSTLSENTARGNTGDGIHATEGGESLLVGNSASSNGGYGLNLQDPKRRDAGFRGNVVMSNTMGTVLGGANAGGNICTQGPGPVTGCP